MDGNAGRYMSIDKGPMAVSNPMIRMRGNFLVVVVSGIVGRLSDKLRTWQSIIYQATKIFSARPPLLPVIKPFRINSNLFAGRPINQYSAVTQFTGNTRQAHN